MKQTAVEWLEDELHAFIHPEHGKDFLPILKQAKEMEKEQMCGFAEFVATYSDKNKNYLGDMLHAKSKYDGAERTIDLLEKYYNETFKTK